MRVLIDRTLRLGIKLCMLTGVAFTFASCYGLPPKEAPWYNDPVYQQEQEQVDQQIHQAVEETPSEQNEAAE